MGQFSVIPAQAGILVKFMQWIVSSRVYVMSDKIPACAGMTAFVIFQAAVKVLQRLQPKIHPIRQPEI